MRDLSIPALPQRREAAARAVPAARRWRRVMTGLYPRPQIQNQGVKRDRFLDIAAQQFVQLFRLQRSEVERDRTRTDRRQQIVGVLRGHYQDQVIGRLFQGLEERVRGLLVGAVHVVDQEDAPIALVRQELRAFL